jgi:hypothetical protein
MVGGVGEVSQQPTPGEGSPSVLFRSSSGPTTCTVYGPGHATQIIFESPQLDVRAECQLWSANEAGAGYLWGYRADALPNATPLCSLTNPKRNLTATVIEESESLPISPDERARGVSACNNILASGWTPYRRVSRPLLTLPATDRRH